MTITCGIHINGDTWVGCDTMAIQGDSHKHTGDVHKWIVASNGCGVGMCGSARLINLMHRHSGRILDGHPSVDIIIDRIQSVYLQHDFETARDNVGPRRWGDVLLIATPEGLFDVDGSFGYVRIPDGTLTAIGSGCEYAIGAAHVMENPLSRYHEPYPNIRVEKAIQAAIKYDAFCGGHIWLCRLVAPHNMRLTEGDVNGVRSPDVGADPCGEESMGAASSGITYQGPGVA